jgi:cation diffusion facilitator CzcD-associated flavoprotein CzcO
MAAALRKAGIEDFILLEKAHDIGGVWRENRYPGRHISILSRFTRTPTGRGSSHRKPRSSPIFRTSHRASI